MTFAQFFPVSGFAHEAFLLTDSPLSRGYYSDKADATGFACGDYAALDARGNAGLLRIWSFGGAPEEILLVVSAWSVDGSVAADECEAFAAWLVAEAGATAAEAEQEAFAAWLVAEAGATAAEAEQIVAAVIVAAVAATAAALVGEYGK